MQYRTDMALERAQDAGSIPGVNIKESKGKGFTRTDVCIQNDDAAHRLQKPKGTYITFETDEIRQLSQEAHRLLAKSIASALSPLLPDAGDVLIVGLGNRSITSDALGTRTAEKLLVTRHLKGTLPSSLNDRLRGVCVLSPGVLGITGIESCDLVRAAVEHVHPSAVVAIDALAARACTRIGRAIQITDTGIQPGSGVGNHRMGLTENTLGVPVIALGVPTVVHAQVIVREALETLFENAKAEIADAETLSRQLMGANEKALVVTPRDVDVLIAAQAALIAQSLNLALQTRLSEEEISLLMHENI